MPASQFYTRFTQWILSYRLPKQGASLLYAIGGTIFVGFLIMMVTGILLTQFYHPSPEEAYRSLQQMQQIPLVAFLRSIHHFTAQGILAMLLLHVVRVFITGAYKRPRQITWWIGLALLFIMMMGAYFTGTVLRWDVSGADALAHYQEALHIFGPLGDVLTNVLPGSSPMLIRLYSFHIALFPVLLIALMIAHFCLVHFFNLSPTPTEPWSAAEAAPPDQMKVGFSEHLWAIVRFSLLYYGPLILIACFVRAPLLDAPSGEHGPLKPPWPFLWMYGFENVWGIQVIIYLGAVFFGLLALVPLLDRSNDRAFKARRGILASGGVFCLLLVGLTLYGWLIPAQEHKGHHHEEEHHNGVVESLKPATTDTTLDTHPEMLSHSHDP